MVNELKAIVGTNEKILYEGKPNVKCYIFESIFNPLMPFALIWGFIDLSIFNSSFVASSQNNLLYMIPFFLIHMMPVWMYLGGIIFTLRRYKNTYYIITDRAIYVSSGTFSKTINSKPFAELSRINLHRGIFDQFFNVGDIIATTDQFDHRGKSIAITIASVSNYVDIYNIVKKLQTDIYSDIMYPNAKRPEDNPGYNTKYKGF